MKKSLILCGLVVALFAISPRAYVFAQQAPDRGRPEESDEKREAIRKKIETVRIWKMTEALHLNEATAAKLSAYLTQFDQQRRDLAMEQLKSVRELRQVLQTGKPDEASLRRRLDKIERDYQAIHDIRMREYSGLKDILTTEQQARYLIFQHEFQREMRDLISEARDSKSNRERGGMNRRDLSEPPQR
jgi:Spy/CpxP family protein refolding chaperone